ncbi:MAG: hypothetical protein HUJ26_16660 [Planctomycetaceae bacterium]|nr:hypothetical protein [Planctomycetaceae bacterium]
MKHILFTIPLCLFVFVGYGFGFVKPSPPEGDELKNAVKSVDRTYGSKIKRARKLTEISELAERLKSEADEENNSARQYALMIASRDLYMKAGNFQEALRLVEQLGSTFELNSTSIRDEVLAEAARFRSVDPISRWMLSFTFHNAIREALLGEDDRKANELAELAEKSASMSGNRKLVEFARDDLETVESLVDNDAEKEKIDQAFPELNSKLEVRGTEGFPDLKRAKEVGRDPHKGISGADDALNVYFLKLQTPVNINDLFLMINGQMTHLGRGTSLGKISASLDGEQWFPVGEWDTESCLLAAKRKNLWGIKLSGPEMLEIKKIAVKFDYTKGSDRFEVFQVTAVR